LVNQSGDYSVCDFVEACRIFANCYRCSSDQSISPVLREKALKHFLNLCDFMSIKHPGKVEVEPSCERNSDDATSIAKLASESMFRQLSPVEEEILLVILKRIKAEAQKGYFSTPWSVLDREGNMSGRIWHQLRMRGFTVDASRVSWAEESSHA
jgi:hypothetical protein